MWHSANRATRTSGSFFISVCLPFPLAGRPFQRFASSILNNLACFIGICWMDVSFLLRSQGSRLMPLRTLQFYMWGGVSSSLIESARKPHINSPTHKIYSIEPNKNFGSFICSLAYLWVWMAGFGQT